ARPYDAYGGPPPPARSAPPTGPYGVAPPKRSAPPAGSASVPPAPVHPPEPPAHPSPGLPPPAVHPYPHPALRPTYPAPPAEEFATRRAVRPREWVATTGGRAAARRGTFGLVRLRPSRDERERRDAVSAVRRAFGGLRQITVVNPKGGAGKTVATLM